MYSITRLVIGFALFAINNLILRKYGRLNEKKCNIVSVLIAVFISTVLAFVPFENALMNFSTPEAAYQYFNAGVEVQQIVEGEESDFIIGGKNGKQNILIVPKSADGWKIGTGIDTKLVEEKCFEDVLVYIYRYGKTQDYFCMIVDVGNEERTISDSNGSIYIVDEYSAEKIEKTIRYYSTYIKDYEQGYWIDIDGEKIILRE